MLAVGIAFFLHLDKPFWSGMTVVVLANIYTGSVIDKALLRIVGTLIGALLGYVLAGLVANSLLLYLLANFLLISFAVYYYSFSPHAYAYLLGALAAFFVISQLAITPDEAFYVAIWRSVEIGLGVLVSAVGALFIFPNKIQDSLARDVDEIFTQASYLIAQTSRLLLNDRGNFSTLVAENTQLKKKIRKSTEMIGFMRRELGIKRERIDQFRILLDQFYKLSRTLTYFITSFSPSNSSSNHAILHQPIIDVFNAAQQDMHRLKNKFFASRDSHEALLMEAALFNLRQEMANQSQKREKELPTDTINYYLGIMPLLQGINGVIGTLAKVIINCPGIKKQSSSLLSSQALLRNDADLIIGSLKTGLAAILSLVFWLSTNWPNGLTGIISSLIISMKRNLFEMSNTSAYRLLGCLTGTSVTLLPLAFFPMDLYSFLVFLFCAILGFSYFSFKYVRYSYIGLQANIVIVIFMAQAGGPPTELEPALERLAGVIIGIVASFLVGNVLWRTDYFSLLMRHLDKLNRFVIYNLSQLIGGNPKKQAVTPSRWGLIINKLFQQRKKSETCAKANLYDLTNLFWLCRGLIEIFPQGYFKGKKKNKLVQAQKRFEQMIVVQATISHIYESIDKVKAHAMAVHCHVDLKSLEKAIVALYNNSEIETAPITQQFNGELAKLQGTTTDGKPLSDELSHLIAYVSALHQLSMCRLSTF